jgi:hypothetical protein
MVKLHCEWLTIDWFCQMRIKARCIGVWQLISGGIIVRPLQNAPFCPISVLGSNFNPQNAHCIPVVKIFAFLELEQK